METTIREHIWKNYIATSPTIYGRLAKLDRKACSESISEDLIKLVLDVATIMYTKGFEDGAEGEKPTPADGKG